MKRVILIVTLALGLSFAPRQSTAQSIDQLIIQLILDGQKLAGLKDILNDMYRSYQLLDKGYSTIKDIAQGNFNIHKVFLDALLTVSPSVKKYARIIDIITMETSIVSEYKSAFNHFKSSGHFTGSELDYIGKLYDALFKRSLKSINELVMVITDSQLRMSDAERIESIDRIYEDIRTDLSYLRDFNNNTAVLSLHRARSAYDLETMKKMYGIN